MLKWIAVIVIFCHRLLFAFIHCMLYTPLLLTSADPKKGRTGSSSEDGGFLRAPLHIVALTAALTTTYSVMTLAMTGGSGFSPPRRRATLPVTAVSGKSRIMTIG